jgi:hypothetical protein
MKATLISKYLAQKARPAEPVSWRPARQDASPFKPKPAQAARETPKPAAPLFRRATLFDAVDSRARDPSVRQGQALAELDKHRQGSIFSRAREAEPEPEPQPTPEPDIETRLAEAYHRGVQEGLDAARGEAAAARAIERTEGQKRSVIERLDFQMNEYARLADAITTGLNEVELRIADVVAQILKPFVNQAVSRQIIDELVEGVVRLRSGGQSGLMKIRGPERVLNALKKRVSQIAVDVEYVSDGGIEVTIEAKHTNIRSEFEPWADLITSVGEQS